MLARRRSPSGLRSASEARNRIRSPPRNRSRRRRAMPRLGCMTVNLTRIYTKLGDGGETHLGDRSRVSKLHPRVEAYGTVDELNATIGVRAGASRTCRRRSRRGCARIQNDLLDVGADLSVPGRPARPAERRASGCGSAPTTRRGSSARATRSTQHFEPLHSFVIPGGTPAAAQLHVCRTVCRRAERRTIAVGEEANPEVGALPQQALGPAVHPQPRGERDGGRASRAAMGAGRARGQTGALRRRATSAAVRASAVARA